MADLDDEFVLVAVCFYLRFDLFPSVFHYRALLAFKVVDADEDTHPEQHAFLNRIDNLPDVLPRVMTLVFHGPLV